MMRSAAWLTGLAAEQNRPPQARACGAGYKTRVPRETASETARASTPFCSRVLGNLMVISLTVRWAAVGAAGSARGLRAAPPERQDQAERQRQGQRRKPGSRSLEPTRTTRAARRGGRAGRLAAAVRSGRGAAVGKHAAVGAGCGVV